MTLFAHHQHKCVAINRDNLQAEGHVRHYYPR